MMIKPIINVKLYENDYKTRINSRDSRVSYTNERLENPLKKDIFQLNTKPSFGSNPTSIIPADEVFALCDDALKKIEGNVNEEVIDKSIVELVERMKELICQKKPERSEVEKNVFSDFRHEIMNKMQLVLSSKGMDPVNQPQNKDKLIERINDIKVSTKVWGMLYEDGLRLSDVLGYLRRLNKDYPIIWEKSELIYGKSTTDHLQLYSLLSQPLLNAIKYGEGKPVNVVIEEVEKGGKNRLFASFINPETTPIPDVEIDKILAGRGHRAETTKDIYGTGFGFQEMIRILRETGHESDIPNLIERGREKGVCVRVPIIGIKE